jgi:O-methyltransferase
MKLLPQWCRDIGRIAMLAVRGLLCRDPAERRLLRFRVATLVAQRVGGFHVLHYGATWDKNRTFRALWDAYPQATRRARPSHYVIYSMMNSVANLPGDTAECGVFIGTSSYWICASDRHPDSLHHAFDSFTGLPAPTSNDVPETNDILAFSKGDLSASLETARANLAAFDFIRFHPGWIPDTLEQVADRRFSFVHIDVDLYEPTRDAISFFYDRIVPGGILLCDDYGSASSPGARKAFDELIADRPECAVVHLPTGQGYIVKRP